MSMYGGTHLNIFQEQELHRLLEYERHTCGASGNSSAHCAFPLRQDDSLQAELIAKGMLSVKQGTAHGAVVLITSDGYSYFAELQRNEMEQRRAAARDYRVVTFSVMLGAICTILGFLLGHAFA